MGWTAGTQDTYNKVHIAFGRLQDATSYARKMGWGLDVQFPHYRWHSKKNYADNFRWKGNPTNDEAYD